MNLMEFLRERLSEDEAGAREAIEATGSGWYLSDRAVRSSWTQRVAADGPWGGGIRDGKYSNPTADHIVRHAPERILREVEAKRQMIAEHRQMMPRWCVTCDVPGDYQGPPEGCTTIRLLALSYADHPEYDEGWRP